VAERYFSAEWMNQLMTATTNANWNPSLAATMYTVVTATPIPNNRKDIIVRLPGTI
jgi:hypothetical protein